MPWHVIAYHLKQKKEDPWLAEDRVFRDAEFASEQAMLDAISSTRSELARRYPRPDYTILSGSGPESTSPDFPSFVTWLLRDA